MTDTPENPESEKATARRVRDEYTLAFGWLLADLRGDEQAKAALFDHIAREGSASGFINSLSSIAIQALIEMSDGAPAAALLAMQGRCEDRLNRRIEGGDQ